MNIVINSIIIHRKFSILFQAVIFKTYKYDRIQLLSTSWLIFRILWWQTLSDNFFFQMILTVKDPGPLLPLQLLEKKVQYTKRDIRRKINSFRGGLITLVIALNSDLWNSVCISHAYNLVSVKQSGSFI